MEAVVAGPARPGCQPSARRGAPFFVRRDTGMMHPVRQNPARHGAGGNRKA